MQTLRFGRNTNSGCLFYFQGRYHGAEYRKAGTINLLDDCCFQGKYPGNEQSKSLAYINYAWEF